MHKALSNMLQRLLSRLLPAITLRIHLLLDPLSISVSLKIAIEEELLAVSCVAEIGDVLFVGRGVVDFVGEVDSLAVLVVLVVLVLSHVSVGHVMLDGKGKKR